MMTVYPQPRCKVCGRKAPPLRGELVCSDCKLWASHAKAMLRFKRLVKRNVTATRLDYVERQQRCLDSYIARRF